MPGTPNDVEVWDATRFSVSTTSGAYLYSTGGGTLAAITSGASASSYLTSGDCFASFWSTSDGVKESPAGCTLNLLGPFGDSGLPGSKVKATARGPSTRWSERRLLGTKTAFGPPGSFDARPGSRLRCSRDRR